MLYTYYGKGGQQLKAIIPKNNRPFTNIDPNTIKGSSFSKPNPIKHWRKQLLPFYESSSLKLPIYLVENPSNINVLELNNSENICNDIVQQVNSLSTCVGSKKENTCTGGTNHIRRSGSTLYNKNYCSSTRQYLQKKCKTFEQNMMVGKPIDVNKYLFNTTVSSNSDTKINCVTYKPNNKTFNTINSVVSSNYVSKKRTDAIDLNPYNPQKKLEQYCYFNVCNNI